MRESKLESCAFQYVPYTKHRDFRSQFMLNGQLLCRFMVFFVLLELHRCGNNECLEKNGMKILSHTDLE